jgi:RND family efflux transporter MFP subunit
MKSRLRKPILDLITAMAVAGAVGSALAGCGTVSSPTPIPTIVLSSAPVAGSGSAVPSAGSVSASGEIVPASKASLSFPLTGVVNDVRVQAGDKVSVGQILARLDTSILEAQVAQADADVRAMQIHYTYLARTGTDQEHLDSALADVARVQATLDAAKATLAQATLAAPFSGTIASVDIVPSETVVPGQVVIMLGDFSDFRVETTDLSERDVPKVKVGQPAQVNVIALNQSLPGKVTDVSRIASTIGGDVVYKVTIEFDNQPTGLLWGMTADVQIAAAQ